MKSFFLQMGNSFWKYLHKVMEDAGEKYWTLEWYETKECKFSLKEYFISIYVFSYNGSEWHLKITLISDVK